MGVLSWIVFNLIVIPELSPDMGKEERHVQSNVFTTQQSALSVL